MNEPKRYHTIEEIPKMEIYLSDCLTEERRYREYVEKEKVLKNEIQELQKELKEIQERQDQL